MNGFQFLYNDSLYTFVLDSIRWPSVYHYMISIYFDQKYKKRISNTKSILELQLLYSKNKYLTKKVSKDVYHSNLKKAMNAKFTQNPVLFSKLKTLFFNKIQFIDGDVGKIIEEILQIKDKEEKVFLPDFKNTPPKELKQFTKQVSNVLKKIKKLEGVQFQYEMVEDCLLIIYPEHKKIIINSQIWAKNLKQKIQTRMPNFCKLIFNVSKNLKIDVDKRSLYKFSLYFASFILFYHNKFHNVDLFSESRDNIKIILPKIKRSYRENAPKKLYQKTVQFVEENSTPEVHPSDSVEDVINEHKIPLQENFLQKKVEVEELLKEDKVEELSKKNISKENKVEEPPFLEGDKVDEASSTHFGELVPPEEPKENSKQPSIPVDNHSKAEEENLTEMYV